MAMVMRLVIMSSLAEKDTPTLRGQASREPLYECRSRRSNIVDAETNAAWWLSAADFHFHCLVSRWSAPRFTIGAQIELLGMVAMAPMPLVRAIRCSRRGRLASPRQYGSSMPRDYAREALSSFSQSWSNDIHTAPRRNCAPG